MAPPVKHPNAASAASDVDAESSRINLFLHAENTRIFRPPEARRLPVTVVTGFLGSGKTTLLKHILTNRSNLRIAAAINDFAELNIDHDLIRGGGGGGGDGVGNNKGTANASSSASKLVELTNGCVCCALLTDLKDAVYSMLSAGGDVDTDNVNYLVVETSGLTDPLSIVRTLDAQFGKMYRARLDCVVTVVDCDSIANVPPGPALVAQLCRADVVLMNKVDLLTGGEEEMDLVEGRIRSYNPDAVLYRTRRCDVPLSCILDVTPADSIHTDDDGGGGGKSSAVVPITHERTGMPLYVSATGGTLRCSASNVSGGGESTTSSTTTTNSSSRAATGGSNHIRMDRYTSVSATITDNPLSLAKLSRFVTSNSVQKLARMKGVLWIKGIDEYRCVLHLSGRGRLGFELDGCWDGPPRSDLAFIGTDLDEGGLRESFAGCQYLEEEVLIINQDGHGQGDSSGEVGMDALRACPEFYIYNHDREGKEESDDCCNGNITYFRLTGSQVYGYTESEIERDLRIDTDSMNLDLADAVNASVAMGEEEEEKAFLAYTRVTDADDNGRCRVMLCYPSSGCDEPPANNIGVLLRKAKIVLARHFRNVTVCKCGA